MYYDTKSLRFTESLAVKIALDRLYSVDQGTRSEIQAPFLVRLA